jgi:hypothetical protein
MNRVDWLDMRPLLPLEKSGGGPPCQEKELLTNISLNDVSGDGTIDTTNLK